MQPFLCKVLELQTFQQFIADRLDMLNAGVGFSDEFEVEVNMCGDAWGTQSRYRDWLNHMKVGDEYNTHVCTSSCNAKF